MYDQYQGSIFDMDGALLDTEPTHRKAWRQALAPYGMQFDEAAVASLNGSPIWHIAKMIIEHHQSPIDPHQLAREKTAALHNILFDDVTALPLIDVVKRYHGKRPMAVGTGSEHAMAEAYCAISGCCTISTLSSAPTMSAVINPIRKPSCAARS